MEVGRDPKERFSDRVEFYVRSRPRYPKALVEFCAGELGLRPQDHVADIGSGTGFLSELFLENGNVVIGVEPNREMRLAAEKLLSQYAKFQSVQGSAEETGLKEQSVEFVAAGQAFHWFDPVKSRVEFTRILKPSGWVVLTWNERMLEGDDFSRAYEKVVQEFQTDLKTVHQKSVTAQDASVLSTFFGADGYRVASFENRQGLDLEGVLGRAMSSSYLPRLGHERCEEMLEKLREQFGKYAVEGKVGMRYDTKAYYGKVN